MNRSAMPLMISTLCESIYKLPLPKKCKRSYCLLNEHQLARTHPRRMAGHARHAPPVDADRRQDPAEANTAYQSLVERAALCYGPRSDDFAHALPGSHLRNLLRLH